MAGDFSPLTVDTSDGSTRQAPPAMLIALAVGLGSMDMPIPQIATWEWVSWKFPKPIHAGETVYARWTLTQKRPPVHGAKTGIAVWRVDVHTAADGALCAEGEIGAAIVRRGGAAQAEKPAAEGPAQPRRRRRRRGSGQGEAAPAAAAAPAAPPPVAAPDRAPRRRRRKRGGGSAGNGNGNGGGGGDHASQQAPGDAASGTHQPAPAGLPAAAAPAPAPTAASATAADGPLTRVMRRLRRS